MVPIRARPVPFCFQGFLPPPATSLALTKWLFYKLDALSFEDGIAAGVVTNVEARATDDFKAGVRRFTQRKRPE